MCLLLALATGWKAGSGFLPALGRLATPEFIYIQSAFEWMGSSVRGDWHLEEYDLRNSETYGWKASYPTSYESYVYPLSSGIW